MILSVNLLALHLDGDALANFLHLRGQSVILFLQFLDEPVLPVVKGRLVSFNHWYQKVKAGLGVVSPVRWGYWGAVMTAFSLVRAPFCTAKAIMTMYIKLIHRRIGTVSLQICLYNVWYVRRRTWGSWRVNLLCSRLTYRLCLEICDCLYGGIPVLIHIRLLDGPLLNLNLNKFWPPV